MQKNQAGKWIVFAFEDEGGTNPGEPVTGDAANITANIRIDGGAANAVDDTNPTELEDGYYVFDITATEANGDNLLLAPQSATANVNVIGVPGAVWTTPANFNSSVISATGISDVNVQELDGDATAGTNIKNQYDGTTGLTGDNFPATQQQVGSLATGSGGITTIADSVTITSGTPTGTLSDANELDGVFYQVAPSVGVVDFYIEFDIGSSGKATTVVWDGYAQGNGDVANIFGWDWVSSSWQQVGTIDGSNSTNVIEKRFVFTNSMTGTGANAGVVRWRVESSGGTVITNIATDRILCEYTVVAEEAFTLRSGIAQGGGPNYIDLDAGASAIDEFYIHSRVIIRAGTGSEQENIITDYDGTTKRATVKFTWNINPDSTSEFTVTPAQAHCATSSGGYENNAVYIDSTNGVNGTQIGVNGTIDNPVLDMATARTIADNVEVNSNRIVFDKGVDLISFDQDYERFIFDGRNAIPVNTNGFDVSLCSFVQLVLTGTSTSNTNIAIYDTCLLTGYTCGAFNLITVGISGTVTMNQDGATYTGSNVADQSPNGVDSKFQFSSGVTGILLRIELSGEFVIAGMTANDELSVRGNCHITLDSTNNGGTITASGDVKITDNSTVSPTITGGNIIDTLADTNELQTDWADGGRLDTILDARASQTTANAIEADTQDIQARIGTPLGTVSSDIAGVQITSDNIEADTQDIQSRIPTALVSGKMDSDVRSINGNNTAAVQLARSASTIVFGTATATTLSTTQMSTDLTEDTNDHYKGRIIFWKTGVLTDQATDITAYDGATKTLTFTATTEAPSASDTFIIV